MGIWETADSISAPRAVPDGSTKTARHGVAPTTRGIDGIRSVKIDRTNQKPRPEYYDPWKTPILQV